MNIPTNLKYTKSDEWVKVDGAVATIGISDYAQEQLSDIVYVEIPVEVGEHLQKDTTIATLESVKAAADVNLPVTGTISEINEKLPQTPEVVNSDPFGNGFRFAFVFLLGNSPGDRQMGFDQHLLCGPTFFDILAGS